uniref:Core shell protein Gag P30 domain-containing protein n=1 Tax=Buteo japonicus TaxID=224669 RepID=A0A8B9Z6Y2_9AVES
MGGESSKGGILKKSPLLGCILGHWRQIAGPLGGARTKENLIKYCNQWWPLYKLDDGEKWPLNGTLNYNTLLQLMLFLRRGRKWDEVLYVNMFFTLQNHPEWQKEYGINLAPADPLVLALEKEKGKSLKRCCSACSIGQRCLKLGGLEEEEIEFLVAPQIRGKEDSSGAEGFSPIAGQMREKQGEAIQAPLFQAVGNEGPVLVKVPFSVTDLNNWKLAAGNYRDNPDRAASAFEMMIKTQDPDWKDIEAIMQVLFDSTEREIIQKMARAQVEAQVASGVLILFGIRNEIPKAINWSKLYEIKQDRKESPTDFVNKLKDATRKYTTIDPDSEEGRNQLAPPFIGQSSDDIRRKLQNLQGQDARDLGKLLENLNLKMEKLKF